MLTKEIVNVLNEISKISDALYDEGGFLYKYIYGHRCAHTDVAENKINRIEDAEEVLGLFITSATSTPFPKAVGSSVKSKSTALLKSLEKEFFGFSGPMVYLDEDDTSKTLDLIYTNGNDYHKLQLFWSID